MLLLAWLLACSKDAPYEATCDGEVPAWDGAAPTWSDDVQPLVARSCLSCHVDGGLGPMSLETYADAEPWADFMASETSAGRMPPWPPSNCGECGSFQHARVISDEEKAMIAAWAEAGAPEGDAAASDPPAALPTLARVDATVDIGGEFTPSIAVDDDYRCFFADPALDADRFLTGFEVMPGDAREVHHVIVGAFDDAETEAEAAALDATDATPGWACFGGFGVDNVRWVAGYAPGSGAISFPQGSGIRLHAGRKLVIQIHYNTERGAWPDRTSLALMLEASVDREARIENRGLQDFELPPGEEAVTHVAEYPVPGEGLQGAIHGIAPHLHQLGRSIRAELVHADGSVECLIDVPQWDFHWQAIYFREDPVQVYGGDTVRVTCIWDTRGVDETVTWGEGTSDEMCLVIGYFVPA